MPEALFDKSNFIRTSEERNRKKRKPRRVARPERARKKRLPRMKTPKFHSPLQLRLT
jgi:hypothetical protein